MAITGNYKLKVHYRVHKSPPLVPIFSHMHLDQTFPPQVLKTHSNIIFPSTPKSSQWSLPFRFSDQNSVCIYNFSNACNMLAHLILFHLIPLTLFGEMFSYEAPHYAININPYTRGRRLLSLTPPHPPPPQKRSHGHAVSHDNKNSDNFPSRVLLLQSRHQKCFQCLKLWNYYIQWREGEAHGPLSVTYCSYRDTIKITNCILIPFSSLNV
jgi:hypothetical protein